MSALTAGSLMMKSPLVIGDATRRVASRPVAASRRSAALCSSLQSSAQHTQKEVRVVVSHDGRLVSADLPSGTYTVSSWWNGAATRKEKALDAVPACDARQGTDCALFCTWTSPGDLVRPRLGGAAAPPPALSAGERMLTQGWLGRFARRTHFHFTVCSSSSPLQICEGITEGVYQVVSAEPTEQCSFDNGVANCGDGGAQNTDAARWTSVPKSHVGALGG